MLFKQFICRPSLETESSVRHVSTINFVSGETEEKEWGEREKEKEGEKGEKRERDKESGMSFVITKKRAISVKLL